MMATTHGFLGGLLALPLFVLYPELALAAFIAAYIGGVFPDLDLYYGHRRLLHYPIYYSMAALITLPFMLASPNIATISAWFFLAGASLHCLSDKLGGSKDSRPWKNDSGKAVYSHYHGEWWEPKKWIRYDGSPEDFLIMLIASLPAIYVLKGNSLLVALALIIISFLYTLLRKKGMEIVPNVLLRSQ